MCVYVCVCVYLCRYLCLCVGLQSEKAAHLSAFGVDDSGSHKIGRVGIHSVQQSDAKA